MHDGKVLRVRAYYNEIDPYAAQWLRNLIAAGLIAPGDVDERSIRDVRADDLRGYSQCHFFAGIGGWSVALRGAGWADDRPVWTGSCPCQPFSAAGAGKAADDERHLWPAWFPLIEQLRPAIVFGEQVEAAIGWGWLDLVLADMEGAGYACGAAVLPACGVGAPHIRNRCWFVADADGGNAGAEGLQRSGEQRQQPQDGGAGFLGNSQGRDRRLSERPFRSAHSEFAGPSEASELGNAALNGGGTYDRLAEPRSGSQEPAGGSGVSLDVAHPEGRRFGEQRHAARSGSGGHADGGSEFGIALGDADSERSQGRIFGGRTIPQGRQVSERSPRHAGVLRDFWSDAEWIACTDGKSRPVKPIAQRMGDGLPESPSRLCADRIAEAEREILNAAAHQNDAREAVHNLWLALWPKAVRGWTAGRPLGVHEAGFLLAFMRQLTEQGWAFSESVSRAGAETAQGRLRGMRSDEAAACASCGRGLDEQRPLECPNALHILSSILARHAQTSWAEAFAQNARDAFPLAHGIQRRPSKLRAYGNAIVPQVAAEFIRAYLDVADADATPSILSAEYANGR